jgi:hypothetical protein
MDDFNVLITDLIDFLVLISMYFDIANAVKQITK